MLHRFISPGFRSSLGVSLLAGALLAGTVQTAAAEELAIADLPVELDLDDEDADYDAIYGGAR